ncbi:MAG: SUMF1/EgtB/PvdO family nonheme iron enzyme, partial [Planctomycetes bacterium]|nr:SUMF1/EgtB/PvdO family nonheme iron enzyme [Planctomycetota bacterium]
MTDFEGGELSDYPCIGQSWTAAVAYCEWLVKLNGRKIRLPTEAEWEYACCVGDQRTYPWGNDFPPKEIVGNFADEAAAQRFGKQPGLLDGYDDGHAYCGPIGSYEQNPWGL